MEPQFINYDAILFPADGRPPQVVQLMTSPASYTGQEGATAGGRVAHPEVHMEYIAENLGPRAWAYQLIEALDGMNKKFTQPYAIFYPLVSRDGMPFPVNKTVRDIQGKSFRQENAWHGSLVIAKYRDTRYSQMMDASMADFPLIKNWLMHHGSPLPGRVSLPSSSDTTGSTSSDSNPRAQPTSSSSSTSVPYPYLEFIQDPDGGPRRK